MSRVRSPSATPPRRRRSRPLSCQADIAIGFITALWPLIRALFRWRSHKRVRPVHDFYNQGVEKKVHGARLASLTLGGEGERVPLFLYCLRQILVGLADFLSKGLLPR